MLFIISLFILLPLAELYVLLHVSEIYGLINSLATMLAIAILGGAIARRQGRKVWLELQAKLNRGEMPADEMLHAVLIFLGGLLMVVPGFITDVFGMLMVFPLTRALFMRSFRGRLNVHAVHSQRTRSAPPTNVPEIIDIDPE